MNVFFVYDDGTLVTPPLTGTILPGITRDSVMHAGPREPGTRCARSRSASTSGAPTRRSGRLREAFACGTAAVITPIGTVRSADGEFTIADGGTGRGHRRRCGERLVDIQRGRADDPYGWVRRVL